MDIVLMFLHDRLWVHFSCLCFISFHVVYLLHKVSDSENISINFLKLQCWSMDNPDVILSLKSSILLKQEYKEITRRRIEHLKYHGKRPDQYTILVWGIPTCPDHGTYGCYVDHFFSKHYQTYQSYQIVHDIGNIEALQVSRLLIGAVLLIYHRLAGYQDMEMWSYL